MRNPQAQREPAGRFKVGGRGVACETEEVSAGTGGSGLGQRELAGGGVVIENFGIAPPLNGGFKLAARFVLAEMFVEQVAEKFIAERAIGLGFERLLHLTEQRYVGEGGFAEDGFARLNVRLRERLAFGCDDGVAFFDAQQAEENGGVHGGQERVDFQAQFIGKAMQIRAAAMVGEDFQQAGHAAWAGVRQHDGLWTNSDTRADGARWRQFVLVAGLRENAIDGIDKLDEFGGFAIARVWHFHGEIRVNVCGIAAEDNDAIREDYGFLDIVGDDKNGARGNFVAEPKLEKFAAQSFRGEDIERGKRFVHEKHFRFDDQGAGDTHALLHAAGKFLGIGGFETVEADSIDDTQRALVALDGRHAAGFERSLDVFENREPGEERETLEDDGDVGRFALHGLAVPEYCARGRGRESRQHAEQSGFAAAGSAEQRDDLAGIDGEIGGGDDLDAAAIGLRIEFFELASLDDGDESGGRAVCSAHERVYYRSTAGQAHSIA
jgi:hypothetical protein